MSPSVDTLGVERVSIPRGAVERAETPLSAALREFVEEVLLYPDSIQINLNPILLTWRDCGKKYSYQIFVGLVEDLSHMRKIYSNFTFTEYNKLIKNNLKHSIEVEKTDASNYRFTIKRCGGAVVRCEQPRVACVCSFSEYSNFIKKYQSKFYEESNYESFLENISTTLSSDNDWVHVEIIY